MKTVMISLLVTILLLSGCYRESASREDGVPLSPLQGTFTMTGVPKLKHSVNITFTFYASSFSQNTVATITLPDEIEYVSGITNWHGDLSTNQTVTLDTTINLIKTGHYAIEASVNGGVPGFSFGYADQLYVSVSENSGKVTYLKPEFDHGIERAFPSNQTNTQP